MIIKLTQEQEAYLPEFRQKWLEIGLDTKPADRVKTERAIGNLYEWAGHKKPTRFIWMSSPFGCQIYLNLLKKCSKLDLKKIQLRDQLRDQLGDQLRGQLGGQLWDQLRGQLRDQLWDQLRDQLRDQLGGQLWDQKLEFFDFNYWTFSGSTFAYYVAWLKFGKEIGVKYDEKLWAAFDNLETLARESYWWYPYEDFVVISDKPAEVHFDETGLNNSEGPAILFRDGYTLWSIEGVRVPQKVVMEPEKLTVEEIEKEANAEVRRIMIERLGPKRYMLETKAECIDYSAGLGLVGSAPRALYKTAKGEKWLAGSDGSTKRVYWMPVPEEVTTCAEAHKAISGMDSENRLLAEA